MSEDGTTALDGALRAVSAAPAGSNVAAFFDMGGTLMAQRDDEVPEGSGSVLGEWAGRPVQELLDESAKRFRKGGAAGLSYQAWDLVKAHQRRGHTVVMLAGATRDQALPVAAECGIEELRCSEPEVTDGRLTGRLNGGALDGPAKLAAAEQFAAERGIDLGGCFAYADGGEDAGLLAAVGHPVAVNPDESLRAEAARRGWPAVRTFDRAADALGVARTVASYGAFVAATGAGIAAGLLGRRRRAGVDVMSRTFGTVAPAISGVKLDIQGAEHARSHRPAVFIINHQSHLVDAIVTFSLLRDGFTVVAKKEVRAIPVIGQATWLADWAYVSRVGDRGQARAAIQDAVDKLEQGVSVIIAPEGTRSIGPQPGAFKKGAFFMARAAGVPVVPIVMRNCGELMWRNGKALKGGTVQVVVHPPIFCDWTDAEFDERVRDVRRLFVDTLENWPEPGGETG
jgi:putative phosphoserine phosphatase / 1-acylglycerol-3-phosphate O-acyltransferase